MELCKEVSALAMRTRAAEMCARQNECPRDTRVRVEFSFVARVREHSRVKLHIKACVSVCARLCLYDSRTLKGALRGRLASRVDAYAVSA